MITDCFSTIVLRRISRLLPLIGLFLGACATTPPENPTDICDIFEERRSWFKAAKKSEDRWDVPLYVSMAMIFQESSFRAKAKPERTKLLGFIPWFRPTSAYGYAQVLDVTWEEYKEETGRGLFASRTDFADAIDFVGWYNHLTYKRNGVARDDAYRLYLAYHEGHGGLARRTYANKDWLIKVSRRVQRNSTTYKRQYEGCRRELNRPWFLRLLF